MAKNEICGKGRPLSRHPMTPLFSSFYNAFSQEILIFLVRFAHCWKFSNFWSCLGLKVIIKQWRIQDGIPPGCKPRTGFWRPWANWRMAPLGGGVGWGKGARCSKWLFLLQITLLKIAWTLNWLVLNVRASSTRKFEMLLSEKWGAQL